jgi:hypothetical protein
MTTISTSTPTRHCRRCQATDHLRLEDSFTIWHEAMTNPQQLNLYVCVNRKTCSERVNEAEARLKEADLWENYHRECRPRRYTPRKYWADGKRLTFAIAQVLFMQAGMVLEKGRSDFPEGLKSGYIINREWRYTSLLEAIKLIENKPKKKKVGCKQAQP